MFHLRRARLSVADASRFFSQKQLSRKLSQSDTPVIRKHTVMPKGEIHAENYESAYLSFWKRRKRRLAAVNPDAWLQAPHTSEYGDQVSNSASSATKAWRAATAFASPVVPRHLFRVEYPGGDLTPTPPIPGRSTKRTPKDRRAVEAVLKVSIPSLAQYVSPEMLDNVKKSRHYARDEDILLLRNDKRLSQASNKRACIQRLDCLLRNISSAILYGENEIEKSQ